MTLPLTLEALPSLPAARRPAELSRVRLRPGILHLGVGNFHRAHQAVYLDDLFNAGQGLGLGAGRRGVAAQRRRDAPRLEPQDWLTTVVELEPGAKRPGSPAR